MDYNFNYYILYTLKFCVTCTLIIYIHSIYAQVLRNMYFNHLHTMLFASVGNLDREALLVILYKKVFYSCPGTAVEIPDRNSNRKHAVNRKRSLQQL